MSLNGMERPKGCSQWNSMPGYDTRCVPFKDLKISSRNDKEWLALNRTKEELRSMPAYEPTGRSIATSASSLSTANWLASDIFETNVFYNFEKKIRAITGFL